jgi:pSer/pThr/pTyr-binding forkhead associated (FHA) protein
VLVTYTWHPEGDLFPVREGRNLLGSSPECEISVLGDGHLSGRHAILLFRGKDFWIDDEKSMNGTFVHGESVEEKQRLASGARILTGATEWLFLAFDKKGED